MKIAAAESNDDLLWMLDITNPDILYVHNICDKLVESIIIKGYGSIMWLDGILFYVRSKFSITRTRIVSAPTYDSAYVIFEEGCKQFIIGWANPGTDPILLAELSAYYYIPFVVLGHDTFNEPVDGTHNKVSSIRRLGYMFCEGFEYGHVKIYTPKNNPNHSLMFNEFIFTH